MKIIPPAAVPLPEGLDSPWEHQCLGGQEQGDQHHQQQDPARDGTQPRGRKEGANRVEPDGEG